MNPAIARTLKALLEAHNSGDMVGVAACYAPEAILRAPFLSEPLAGWAAIERHLAEVVMPHLHGLDITETRDLGDEVVRVWRAQVKDRQGDSLPIQGESRYRFSAEGLITEVVFVLDEASLRSLVLRRD